MKVVFDTNILVSVLDFPEDAPIWRCAGSSKAKINS
jgi:predicted nucleic acid-binding protein